MLLGVAGELEGLPSSDGEPAGLGPGAEPCHPTRTTSQDGHRVCPGVIGRGAKWLPSNPWGLYLNPDPTSGLPDLGHLASPLRASISSPMKYRECSTVR